VTADLSFKIATRRREPITFTLGDDDHIYSFDPPKQSVLVLPVLATESDNNIEHTRAVLAWLDAGLSKEDQECLEARLRDPEDDLDFDMLGPIVEGLMEKVSGRPT
jgi:hypothetical protein